MDEGEWQGIIKKGMAHRGWIANSYAQIEFLLGDLIVRCRDFPEYAALSGTLSHSAPKRVKKVRSILAVEGPLSPFSESLENVLVGFEQNHDLRNLLAHGFLEFLHTPSGDAGFYFRKFERAPANSDETEILKEETLRLIELEYHRAQLVSQAQSCLHLFQEIHTAFGWGEVN